MIPPQLTNQRTKKLLSKPHLHDNDSQNPHYLWSTTAMWFLELVPQADKLCGLLVYGTIEGLVIVAIDAILEIVEFGITGSGRTPSRFFGRNQELQ